MKNIPSKLMDIHRAHKKNNGQEIQTNTSTGAVKHTQGRRTLTMQKYRMTLEC